MVEGDDGQVADTVAQVADAVADGVRRVMTAADIFRAADPEPEWVPLEEWGGPGAGVFIKGLTALERDTFEQTLVIQGKGRTPSRVDMTNARAKLVAQSAVNAEGVRVFADRDVKELGNKNALLINRLYEAATKLSGMRDEDLEEALQGFPNAPSEPSPTT